MILLGCLVLAVVVLHYVAFVALVVAAMLSDREQRGYRAAREMALRTPPRAFKGILAGAADAAKGVGG